MMQHLRILFLLNDIFVNRHSTKRFKPTLTHSIPQIAFDNQENDLSTEALATTKTPFNFNKFTTWLEIKFVYVFKHLITALFLKVLVVVNEGKLTFQSWDVKKRTILILEKIELLLWNYALPSSKYFRIYKI